MTLDDLSRKSRKPIERLKIRKKIESVTAYCKEKVASFSFKERDALAKEAIKLLEEKKLEEASVLFKRVNDLGEL
jgi:hypothetical protein